MSNNIKTHRNNKTPQKLENVFDDFITRFHRMILNAMRDEAFELNLNISQVEVLHYLIDNKSPTMKDIATYLNIKPPSVTSIVELLSGKKLVKRVIDKNDSRIIRIAITPKALERFSKVKNKKIAVIKKMFLSLSLKDKSELMRILSVLSN